MPNMSYMAYKGREYRSVVVEHPEKPGFFIEIVHGESGYTEMGYDFNPSSAQRAPGEAGWQFTQGAVPFEVERAFTIGSSFGWHVPGAQPEWHDD